MANISSLTPPYRLRSHSMSHNYNINLPAVIFFSK
jgi:hypothetical protein